MTLDNFLKYMLIAVTYKIWWPILKSMWTELQGALWREGGLIGGTPSARNLIILEEKYGHIESPLTSETYAQVKLREQQEELEEKRGEGGGPNVVHPAARREKPGASKGNRSAPLGPADYGRPRRSTPSSGSPKAGFGSGTRRTF